MEIKVLFFAQLREAFGTGERFSRVARGITVGEFVKSLFKEPGAAPMRRLPLLYSVNEDFVHEDCELKDQDTLALLPPVAGG